METVLDPFLIFSIPSLSFTFLPFNLIRLKKMTNFFSLLSFLISISQRNRENGRKREGKNDGYILLKLIYFQEISSPCHSFSFLWYLTCLSPLSLSLSLILFFSPSHRVYLTKTNFHPEPSLFLHFLLSRGRKR